MQFGKKTGKKIIFIFSPKSQFLWIEKCLYFEMGMTMNQIFPKKLSEFEISHSVGSYYKKKNTAKNKRNYNNAEKQIVSKL